ncbi:MAG: 2-phospho-L-lactate guanylyltransferase [Actinomycetota bacterium]|jgi:2-phospho-L-lactate guanylyltransferase
MEVALVVPVKSFAAAKGRLAGAITDGERENLARTCAARVVGAGSPWTVYVVCDDDATAEWAQSLGARPVRQTAPGLNAAVEIGVDAARAGGAGHVVVSHADLPLATSFAHLVHPGEVTLVPDRHRDGTNVLSLPAGANFAFRYGPGSFAAHVESARHAGLPCRIVDDASLSLDLDTADDLDELTRRRTRTP